MCSELYFFVYKLSSVTGAVSPDYKLRGNDRVLQIRIIIIENEGENSKSYVLWKFTGAVYLE